MNEAILFKSSDDNSKSNTWVFSKIRFGVTDFGITTKPRWTWKRIKTCAVDLLYLDAISFKTGSFNNEGSSALAHGRSGDPECASNNKWKQNIVRFLDYIWIIIIYKYQVVSKQWLQSFDLCNIELDLLESSKDDIRLDWQLAGSWQFAKHAQFVSDWNWKLQLILLCLFIKKKKMNRNEIKCPIANDKSISLD